MTNEVIELFELASGDLGSGYIYGSRAASVQDDVRVTEMINGVLVSRPAKKNEPVVIDLQKYAKSGKAASSTPAAVNPVKEIFEFINRGY